MEQASIITARFALLDAASLGLGVSVFVAIEIGDHSAEWIADFAAVVVRTPEIVECWRMGRDVDYMLRVVVADMPAYDAFYRGFVTAVPSLRKITGRFAMQRVKFTMALPI